MSADRLRSLLDRYRASKAETPQGFVRTELGSLIRQSFATKPEIQSQYLSTFRESANEESIELFDLLQSIDDARGSWTMAEIGAGYGRWLVAGAVAARRTRNIPINLIAAEPENDHLAMLLQHLRDNGIDPRDHRVIHGAVSATEGPVWFTQGSASEWYGQAILPKEDYGYGDVPNVVISRITAYCLETILGRVGTVDLVDVDIQGAELDVVRASHEVLHRKVKRLHVATHSREIEDGLRAEMLVLGWERVHDYPCNSTTETEFGRISFVDGVQTWRNTKI